ncbi:uncharacterized protein TNCV_167071 [Trichonephila clavipes]|nr:uncharacterized protein TNCV_167071 [Trichonephila clavipes]
MKERDLVMGRTQENPDILENSWVMRVRVVNHTNKGTSGLEDLRFKRKNEVRSSGTAERYDRKRSKICRKRSLQGSEHRDPKRQVPVLPQGLKRTVPSSVSSTNINIGEIILTLHRDQSQFQVRHINKR